MDQVLPIGEVGVLRARETVLAATGPSARGALHLAVVETNGIARGLSFDRVFDGHPGTEPICRHRPNRRRPGVSRAVRSPFG